MMKVSTRGQGGVREKDVGRRHYAGEFALRVFTMAGRQENSALWGLFSEKNEELIGAIAKAGNCKSKKAVPILHGLLFHEKTSIRILTATTLAGIGEPSSTFFLLRALLLDNDVQVKREIARIVGEFSEKLKEQEKRTISEDAAKQREERERLMALLAKSQGTQVVIGVENAATLNYRDFVVARLWGIIKDTNEDKFVRMYAMNSLEKFAVHSRLGSTPAMGIAGIACIIAAGIANNASDEFEVRVRAVEFLSTFKEGFGKEGLEQLASKRDTAGLNSEERQLCNFAWNSLGVQGS
ncbi:HEAT repeat domain-containing protein [Candidatus Micrarchaeota archaeon]|nr:HEAT repeat domain-containing protein [Candidatus Micrarchaeota archaeon]